MVGLFEQWETAFFWIFVVVILSLTVQINLPLTYYRFLDARSAH